MYADRNRIGEFGVTEFEDARDVDATLSRPSACTLQARRRYDGLDTTLVILAHQPLVQSVQLFLIVKLEPQLSGSALCRHLQRNPCP